MRQARQTAQVVCASLLLALSCSIAACQRGIGDACDTALRCSTAGTRLCDTTQPDGYCTLSGCDVGTCPAEAVCVKFWPKVTREADKDRLGTNFCMRKCDEPSDCRDTKGYTCTSASKFGAMDEAEVLGNAAQRFCAVRSSFMSAVAVTDADSPEPNRDAGR